MSCLCSKDNLLNNGSGIVRMLFKVILKHFRNRLRNSRSHFPVPQFGLGLSLELRLLYLYRDNGSKTLPEVISRDLKLEFVKHARSIGVFFKGCGQTSSETGKVSTPFVSVDVVYVRMEVFVE